MAWRVVAAVVALGVSGWSTWWRYRYRRQVLDALAAILDALERRQR